MIITKNNIKIIIMIIIHDKMIIHNKLHFLVKSVRMKILWKLVNEKINKKYFRFSHSIQIIHLSLLKVNIGKIKIRSQANFSFLNSLSILISFIPQKKKHLIWVRHVIFWSIIKNKHETNDFFTLNINSIYWFKGI